MPSTANLTARVSLALSLLALLAAGIAGCSQMNHERGAGLYTQQRYFESEYYLQRTLEADPTDANAALLLAVVYRKTYREKQAEPLLQQLAQSATEDPVDKVALPEFAGMSASAAARQLLGQPQRNSEALGALEEQILSKRDAPEPTAPPQAPQSNKRDKRYAAQRPQTASADAPAEPAPPRAPKGKAFGVHILSVQEAGQVNKAAAVLKSKLPKLFAGKQVRSHTADLGAKGVFHRVVLGPYATRGEAEKACATAKKAYSYCAVFPF